MQYFSNTSNAKGSDKNIFTALLKPQVSEDLNSAMFLKNWKEKDKTSEGKRRLTTKEAAMEVLASQGKLASYFLTSTQINYMGPYIFFKLTLSMASL